MISRPTIGPSNTSKIMRLVLVALLPGMICSIWVYGAGVLFNVITCTIIAGASEALCLKLRKREILRRLEDCSALLIGWLVALSIPQAAPWWIAVSTTACAVVFGKHLYGGLGQNPLNPAMLGYALILISAPIAMTTTWVDPLNPPPLTSAWQAFLGQGNDAYTGATTLDLYRTQFKVLTQSEISSYPLFSKSVIGLIAGTEWVVLAYLIGGLFLLHQRIITWHAPVGFIASLAIISALFGFDPDQSTPMWVHLTAGATIFGAFFILTDPVSGATSPLGQLWFGVGVGTLVYLIRTTGQYPDAVAFAVLIMNFSVPIIDLYTRPRIYGHKSSIKGVRGGRV